MLSHYEIGNRFKQIRTQHNLNQTQFANYLSEGSNKDEKISRVTIGKIEEGTNLPSFKRVLRMLKFDERYKFHCTRHTFATELADRNVPQHIIQDLLGHADMKSTAVYLHINRDEKFSAVCKL